MYTSTNALSVNSVTRNIMKYVDDTVILDLTNSDNEEEYRHTMSCVTSRGPRINRLFGDGSGFCVKPVCIFETGYSK